MYHLELVLTITHEDGARPNEPIEQVKKVIEKLSVGDENHPKMAGALKHMIARLFARLSEVEGEAKKKVIAPKLVTATAKQAREITKNRVFGA